MIAKACKCQSGLKDDVHKIPKGKSIEQWVKDNASNLEKWEKSGTGDTHAHLLQKGDQLLLAWFTTANNKVSAAHYRTVGYHVSDSRYSAGTPSNPSNTSFRKGDGRDLLETGSESKLLNPDETGFTQIRVPYDSGRRRADVMIVNYNKVVDICEEMGIKPRKENGVYGYHVYFHGYVSVFKDANENKAVCNAANNYASVLSAMATIPFATSNYPDILQRYNIRFNIPAVVMPVKLRIMTPSQEDNEYLEYTLDKDGKPSITDTGLHVTGKSALNAKGELIYDVDL